MIDPCWALTLHFDQVWDSFEPSAHVGRPSQTLFVVMHGLQNWYSSLASWHMAYGIWHVACGIWLGHAVCSLHRLTELRRWRCGSTLEVAVTLILLLAGVLPMESALEPRIWAVSRAETIYFVYRAITVHKATFKHFDTNILICHCQSGRETRHFLSREESLFDWVGWKYYSVKRIFTRIGSNPRERFFFLQK